MSLHAGRTISTTTSAVFGGVLWLAFVVWRVTDFRTLAWSTALLGFAALVLVPLLLDLIRLDGEKAVVLPKIFRAVRGLQFPAAGLLLASCIVPGGRAAALLASPWIALTAMLAGMGAYRLLRRGFQPLGSLCQDAGLIFIAVGGAWTLADRLGLHPLGFGTDIVQLTAVHFHFAGLVLPVVTGLVVREFPSSRIATIAGWGVLAGVPLVAVGITSSQLGQTHALEFFAALVLAGSAMIVACFQLRLVTETRWPLKVRMWWSIAGFSLVFGMSLALLYAARPYFAPLPWLDLPWMRALHGTVNALGFAFCALLGWRLARSEVSR